MRLSKLQKWILINCALTINSRRDVYENGFLFTSEVVDACYGKGNPKGEVAVSRSLRTLIKAGLIVGLTPRKIIDPKFSKVNPVEFLKNPRMIKMDIATVEAMKVPREGRTEAVVDDFEKKLANLQAKHGKSASLLSPVRYIWETIKITTLTDKGLKTAQMLSFTKAKELNNKNL